MRKKVVRMTPSIRLKATEGRTGWRQTRTVSHVSVYQGASATLGTDPACTDDAAAGTAHPAPRKRAFVKIKISATKIKILKISAKIIDPTAAVVAPFFNSSCDFGCVGTGKSPGTAPVIPAKSPSPSMTAGDNATLTSFAASASTKASLAE